MPPSDEHTTNLDVAITIQSLLMERFDVSFTPKTPFLRDTKLIFKRSLTPCNKFLHNLQLIAT